MYKTPRTFRTSRMIAEQRNAAAGFSSDGAESVPVPEYKDPGMSGSPRAVPETEVQPKSFKLG